MLRPFLTHPSFSDSDSHQKYLLSSYSSYSWNCEHISKQITKMWNDEYGSQQTPERISIFYMITMLDSLMLVAPNPEVPHSYVAYE